MADDQPRVAWKLRSDASESDPGLWEIIRRLRFVLALFALDVAIFSCHVMPALRENRAVDRAYADLDREVHRLERKARELTIRNRALQSDPYYITTEVTRRRNALSGEDVIVVVKEPGEKSDSPIPR